MAVWLEAGQDYEAFWRMTPREIHRILTARSEQRTREHDEARARNYEMAQWLSFSFNDPKNLPDFKATGAKPDQHNDELDQARVRGFFIGLANRGNA